MIGMIATATLFNVIGSDTNPMFAMHGTGIWCSAALPSA